ncbi:hypothetical protein AAKU58_000489 [Oxalobacteraceae bacterium GrIS 1.18]
MGYAALDANVTPFVKHDVPCTGRFATPDGAKGRHQIAFCVQDRSGAERQLA